MNPPNPPISDAMTAGQICRLVAERTERGNEPTEADRSPTSRTDVALYVYGAGANDPILVGAEHSTTLLMRQGEQRRWFRVEITEFDPEEQPPWQRDQRISLILTHRAAAYHS